MWQQIAIDPIAKRILIWTDCAIVRLMDAQTTSLSKNVVVAVIVVVVVVISGTMS